MDNDVTQEPVPKAGEKLPMTEAELIAKVDDAIAAAQAAGLRHVPFIVAKHLLRKGLSMIELMLDAADQGYSKNGKR